MVYVDGNCVRVSVVDEYEIAYKFNTEEETEQAFKVLNSANDDWFDLDELNDQCIGDVCEWYLAENGIEYAEESVSIIQEYEEI